MSQFDFETVIKPNAEKFEEFLRKNQGLLFSIIKEMTSQQFSTDNLRLILNLITKAIIEFKGLLSAHLEEKSTFFLQLNQKELQSDLQKTLKVALESYPMKYRQICLPNLCNLAQAWFPDQKYDEKLLPENCFENIHHSILVTEKEQLRIEKFEKQLESLSQLEQLVLKNIVKIRQGTESNEETIKFEEYEPSSFNISDDSSEEVCSEISDESTNEIFSELNKYEEQLERFIKFGQVLVSSINEDNPKNIEFKQKCISMVNFVRAGKIANLEDYVTALVQILPHCKSQKNQGKLDMRYNVNKIFVKNFKSIIELNSE